ARAPRRDQHPPVEPRRREGRAVLHDVRLGPRAPRRRCARRQMSDVRSNEEAPRPDRERRRIVLLGSVFLVSACGLAYELIAGAIGSYLMGDAVTQFSLVVGVFLSAMGLGAYLAQHVRAQLLGAFVELEIGVGLVGGVSSLV